jgi:hypothetical protein
MTRPPTVSRGRIAVVAVFARALSLADIRSWQLQPRQVVGSHVAIDFTARERPHANP